MCRSASSPRRPVPPPQPCQESCPDHQAEDRALKRAAVRQHGQPHAHCRGMTPMRRAHDSGERAGDQGAARRGHSAAPVAVHPVTRNPQPQNHQAGAQQRPARRQPSLKHPANRAAHQTHAQPHASPRVAEQDFAGRQRGPRGDRERACISRPDQDVHALEVDPQGVLGVHEAAVREGVRHQQVAELVVGARLRSGEPREQQRAQEQRRQGGRQNRQLPAPGEARQRTLPPREPARPEARGGQRQ